LSLQNPSLWPFIKSDFNNSFSGIDASRNLLYMELFEKALSNIKKQEKGFYLQENQGWESAFIQSWKGYGHDDCLVAVPHTPIKFWDLRRFVDKEEYVSSYALAIPLPDYIGVNSDLSKSMHLANNYPHEKILELEALRYLHLNNIRDCMQSEIDTDKKVVLVLGDYLRENVTLQMQTLLSALKYVNISIQYLIKSHPAAPICAEDYPNMDLVVTNRPIDEIVNCCDLVYAGSTTSSSVDAYCQEKTVVTITNPKLLNISPLKGCKDAIFVNSSKELSEVLNSLRKTTKKSKQRESFLYIDNSLPMWKELLGL